MKSGLESEISFKIEEAGEGEATGERHLHCFLALAVAAEPQLTGACQMEWLERLETEHDNLRAALAFARSEGLTAPVVMVSPDALMPVGVGSQSPTETLLTSVSPCL